MKIGILTYHRAHNYGAMLQAYALRHFLAKKYSDVSFVDYWPRYHAEEYKLLPFLRSGISFAARVRIFAVTAVNLTYHIRRYFRFIAFARDRLGLQRNKCDESKRGCDCVVYGSDQIWRRHTYKDFTGFDSAYFGDDSISAKVKITYAASMGAVNLSEKDHEWLLIQAQRFNSISVRENDLQKILVDGLGSKQIVKVLDPVFLVDRKEWQSIADSDYSKPGYVLLYLLNPSKKAKELAGRIAKERNLRLVEIGGGITPISESKCFVRDAGPVEFISLMLNADFVVSTSYHGVVFSIIFEKQFLATGMGNNSSRVRTLLGELKIAEKYLDEDENLDHFTEIDYGVVNERLDDLKQKSRSYLCETIDYHVNESIL